MTDLLSTLDPVRERPVPFDPDAPQARAVLAAALLRGEEQPAPDPAPRRPRLRVAAVCAAALAAAVLGVALGSSGGPSGLSPAQALAQAADRTAGFTSGHVRWSGESTGPGYRVVAVNDVRFSGDDILIVSRTEERLPDGSDRLVTGDYLQRGERQWLRAPGGDWREQARAPKAGGYAEQIRDEVTDDALLDAIRAAADVRREGDTLRASLSSETLRDLADGATREGNVPLTGPGESAEIEVALDEQGRIRRLDVRTPRFTRTVEYDQLGEPQSIPAP